MRFSLIIWIIMSAFFASSISADTSILKLAHKFHDAAINYENGDVLLIDEQLLKPHLYRSAYFDGDTNASQPVFIPYNATSVVYKKIGDKQYYVIGTDGTKLFLIDADTGKLIKEFDTGIEHARTLHASRNPADPFVYFNFLNKSSKLFSYINLNTGWQPAFGGSGRYSTISANGKYIYPISSSTTTGFAVLQRDVNAEEFKFRKMLDLHKSRGLPIPDTRQVYAAARSTIYSADLMVRHGELNGHVVSYSHKHPIIFTIDTMHRVALWAHHDLKMIGRKRLSGALNLADYHDNQYVFHRRFLVDDKHDRLLVFVGNQVEVMPFSEFGYENTPWLLSELEHKPLFVGHAAKAEIKPIVSNARVTLVRGPDGMKLIDGRMEWTPTYNQVGKHRLVTRVTIGELTREQMFTVEVTHPYTRLPFSPTRYAVSADGKQMVAWRADGEYTFSVALIDLKSGRTISQKLLRDKIQSMAVDAYGVYVLTYLGKSIYKLDHELKQIEKLELKSRRSEIASLKAGVLASFSANNIEIIDTKDVMQYRQTVQHKGGSLMRANPFGPDDWRWQFGALLFSRRHDKFEAVLKDDHAKAWGNYFSGLTLYDSKGQVLMNDYSKVIKASRFLESYPGLATFQVLGAEGRGINQLSLVVAYYSLKDGKEAGRFILQRVQRVGGGGVGFNSRVAYSGDTMFVVVNDKLYMLLPDQMMIEKLGKPFMLYTDNMRHTTNSETPFKVLLKATRPVKAYLPSGSLGVTVNQSTGEVTIDPKHMRAPKGYYRSEIKERDKGVYKSIYNKIPEERPVVHHVTLQARGLDDELIQTDIPVMVLTKEIENRQKMHSSLQLTNKEKSAYAFKKLIPQLVFFMSFSLISLVLFFVSLWFIYEKAGRAGWKSLVPLYNLSVWLEIIERPSWWIYLLVLPGINGILSFLIYYELAKKFDRSVAFCLGTSFAPIIFLPILAFDSSITYDAESPGLNVLNDDGWDS